MAYPVYTVSISVAITASSVANPSVITTPTEHGFTTGQTVTIANHSGSTPTINGTRVVTKIDNFSFSIPVNVTVGGTGGTATRVRDITIETLNINAVANYRDTLTAQVISRDASFRPAFGADVIVYEDATAIFGGTLMRPFEAGLGGYGVVPIVTTLEAASYDVLAERVLVTEDVTNSNPNAFPAGTLAFSGFGSNPVKFYSPQGVQQDDAVNGPVECGSGCDGFVALSTGKIGVIGGSSPNFGTTGVGLFNDDWTVFDELADGPSGRPNTGAARDDNGYFYGLGTSGGRTRIYKYNSTGYIANYDTGTSTGRTPRAIAVNGAGTIAYYVTANGATADTVYAWDLSGDTDLGTFKTKAGYRVDGHGAIVALTSGHVMVGWDKVAAGDGVIERYNAAGTLQGTTYTMSGSSTTPISLVRDVDSANVWVSYYDSSLSTYSTVQIVQYVVSSGAILQQWAPEDGSFDFDGAFAVTTTGGGSLKDVLEAIEPQFPDGVSLDANQVEGPTVPTVSFDQERLIDILNQLAQLTGYVWEIDATKTLRMFAPAATPVSFNLAAGDGNAIGDVTVDPPLRDFANRIYQKFGQDGALGEIVFTATGDGSTVTWNLDFPIQQHRGYITCNSVDEPIGVTTPPYWTYTSTTITRSSAPTLGHVISFSYNTQYPATVVVNDTASQSAVGIWEGKADDQPNVYDLTVARQLAQAILDFRVARPRTVRYKTGRTGTIKPGQIQTITLPMRSLTGTWAISEVNTRNTKGNLVWRFITVTEGTAVTETWRSAVERIAPGQAPAPVPIDFTP